LEVGGAGCCCNNRDGEEEDDSNGGGGRFSRCSGGDGSMSISILAVRTVLPVVFVVCDSGGFVDDVVSSGSSLPPVLVPLVAVSSTPDLVNSMGVNIVSDKRFVCIACSIHGWILNAWGNSMHSESSPREKFSGDCGCATMAVHFSSEDATVVSLVSIIPVVVLVVPSMAVVPVFPCNTAEDRSG
jgi:hypothetical protein